MLSVIRRAIGHMLRSIVGEEFGYDGEGNTQWYYIAGILGTLMLIWNHKPFATAILFTIYAALHVITVCITGYRMVFIEDRNKDQKTHAMVYFGFHVILFVAALITNALWAIISAVVVIAMYFLGTDCIGENVFWNECKEEHPRKILVLNTIVFAVLMIIIMQLRASATAKLLIVVGMVVLHYIVDYFQGEGIEIRDVTQTAFSCVGIRLRSWHDSFNDERVKSNIKNKVKSVNVKQKVNNQPNGVNNEVIKPKEVKPESKAEPKNQPIQFELFANKDKESKDGVVGVARVRGR